MSVVVVDVFVASVLAIVIGDLIVSVVVRSTAVVLVVLWLFVVVLGVVVILGIVVIAVVA